MTGGATVVSPRQQRWECALRWFGRLPRWLQYLLIPALFQVGPLCYFPVLMPLLCALVAAVLAFLKLEYGVEQWTWTNVAIQATLPLWFGLLLGYVLITWAAVGTLPWAVFALSRRWWAGEPVRLMDPEPDIPRAAVVKIMRKWHEGRGLAPDDIRVILAARTAAREANSRHLKPVLVVTAASIVLALLSITVLWLIGYHNEETGSFLLLLSFSTLWPWIFLYNPLEERTRLRCRHCGKGLSERLEAVLESNTCVHCSAAGPFGSKETSAAATRLWDAEIP